MNSTGTAFRCYLQSRLAGSLLMLTLCGLLPLACKNTLPHEPAPGSVEKPAIINILPNAATYGQYISIIGKHFDAAGNTLVRLNETWISPKSGSDTHVVFRLPYGMSTGKVGVKVGTATCDGPTLLIVPPARTPLNIEWYSGPAIVESLTWSAGCHGRYREWSAAHSSDTITLVQTACYGDEGSWTRTLTFLNNGSSQLPTPVSALYVNRLYPAVKTDTLKGFITIEHWSVPGVISGRISVYVGSEYDWSDFDFYCTVL